MKPPDNAGAGAPPGAGRGWANGYGHRQRLSESQHAAVELLRYWSVLWRRRWLIGGLTIAVALGVGLYVRLGAVKWYRAMAVVTPVAPGEELDSQIGENPLGGMSGLGALFGVGGPGDNVVTAERYITIMQSYNFGVGLARRNALTSALAGAQAATITPWQLHMLMNARFSTEYDYRTGNLTLYFLDPRPARARAILGLYLQSLRDQLRGEVTQTASAAALSLQGEINRTPDALLQNQLYELMARQLQREKLAQVQADFAFKVVEPPVVPDHYYLPSARGQATLWGLVMLGLLSGFFIAREWLAAARSHLAADEFAARELAAYETALRERGQVAGVASARAAAEENSVSGAAPSEDADLLASEAARRRLG
ncbi:MAG TPA: Wzz/FepE/Etk N-terminal domain-containing protein [Candidatus Binataceae bacterium]|nr:Wzz/FepE/Etk N-terminal domain-containing protein [Candidatus Binataceae bacterium]